MNRNAFREKLLFIAPILIVVFGGAANIFAQADEVLIVKEKARTVIRPKAKPAAKKVDYVKTVSITRVSKKSRKNYRKPTAVVKNAKQIQTRGIVSNADVRKIKVPLLAVQLKLLLVNKDGSESEFNPQATFTPDDRLRLSITANQRGYLYVIRQKSPEESGEIIFPTKLANGGSNLVSANYEYVIPSNCPKEFIAAPRDCALTLAPYADAPQEFFTLIFTRDQLIGLPDDVKNTRVSLVNLMTAGKIESKTLVNLIEDSGQDLVSQAGDTPFAVRIVNTNPNDNEEIIETFVLNKQKK